MQANEKNDVSNTVSDSAKTVAGSVHSIASAVRREADDMKQQGWDAVKTISNQASGSLDVMADEAEVVKNAVVDYVRAKPGTSLMIAVAGLWVLRKLTR